jgi:hypothetical protein
MGLPTGGTTGQILAKNSAADYDVAWITNSGGGGGVGLPSRVQKTGNVHVVARDNAEIDIAAFKSYNLISIQVDVAAWVTVYSSVAARDADTIRLISEDPVPGSGVLAEIITTDATTQYFSPAVACYNADNPVTANAYVRVYNNSVNDADITVTMTVLQQEV